MVAHEHGHLPYAVSVFGFVWILCYGHVLHSPALWWPGGGLKTKPHSNQGFNLHSWSAYFGWQKLLVAQSSLEFWLPSDLGQASDVPTCRHCGISWPQSCRFSFNLFFMIAWKQRNNKPLVGRIIGGVIGCF